MFTIKGYKSFECFIRLDNGERYRVGVMGFNPPDVDEIERMFNEWPKRFTKL